MGKYLIPFSETTYRIKRSVGMSALSKVATKTTTPKLTAEDWLAAAEIKLSSAGIDAVRVEPLAKQLKVTKGSFYWHFKSRQHLLDKLLVRWRTRATATIINRLTSAGMAPAERLYELAALPHKSNQAVIGSKVEIAIRQWASYDAAVLATVTEMDNLRLSFISSIYQELGYSESQAMIKAKSFYCALQGMALLKTENSDFDSKQICEQLL